MCNVQLWRLGCKIPPPKNPSSGKSLLQNPSTETSLPAKSFLRKIPLRKNFLGKIPTSKIPLKIKSLLKNFKYNHLSCFLPCLWLLNYFIVQWITFNFEKCFSNFSCMFLNPKSNLNSNCSNLLDLKNFQGQVKKALCYPKLFWPSASNFKSFSRS